ncbi:MAG: glutamate-5-semialdehyde dehydrogenase [Rhodospirillales bacterium]|nr:glutamate-5-semialdehyde dehydrogenase [Rhodospirillales bacterium]
MKAAVEHAMTLTPTDAEAWMREAAARARAASRAVAVAGAEARALGLRAAAHSLRTHTEAIVAANAEDIAAFDAAGGTAAFRDRLLLTPARVAAMAQGVETVAALPDPLGRTLAAWTRPNGLHIARIAQPLGVVGMIYESRPNVGADAAAICLKSGNAVILRGGSDSRRSAAAIHAAFTQGWAGAGLPADAVQTVPTADRAYVGAMLAASGALDLIVPRGGKGLVRRVQAEARVPVLAHAEGLCHTFVHAAADLAMARAVVVNAKMRRPGVCGATETLLIDRAAAARLLPPIVTDLAARGCRFRADAAAREICPGLDPAQPGDFDTEWLDTVLNVALVDGVAGALVHIEAHGSSHTEAIITEDETAARAFLDGLDSAVGMWNASTQFCDGGEFGFGAEIGIATGRIHARGPVGPEQLTTFRYVVTGTGQVRP